MIKSYPTGGCLALAVALCCSTANGGTSVNNIDPIDVIAEMHPGRPINASTWAGVECNGVYKKITDLADNRVHGTARVDESTLRLGRTPDPLNSARTVLGFFVQQDDALTAGARRCELAAYTNANNTIPIRQRVWYAFSVLADRASSALARDDQLLTQWHVRGFVGFSPFMALYVSQGIFRFEIRHNSLASGTPANTRHEVIWRAPQAMPTRWSNFVIEARISPLTEDNPYIRIWQDGQLLVDHAGPIGYNTDAMAFAKIGLYHWINANNEWDAAVPKRSAYFSNALLVRDPNGRYSETMLRRQLEQP